MASPYLLVGVYPELLRFLPKPGAWMETFKQISGFVLLATVVFILSFIEPAAVVPTLLLLLGIGVACWLIARTPLTAEFGDRLQILGLGRRGRAAVRRRFVRLAVSHCATSRRADMALAAILAGATQASRRRRRPHRARRFLGRMVPQLQVASKRPCSTPKPVEQAIASSGAVTMYADYTELSARDRSNDQGPRRATACP